MASPAPKTNSSPISGQLSSYWLPMFGCLLIWIMVSVSLYSNWIVHKVRHKHALVWRGLNWNIVTETSRGVRRQWHHWSLITTHFQLDSLNSKSFDLNFSWIIKTLLVCLVSIGFNWFQLDSVNQTLGIIWCKPVYNCLTTVDPLSVVTMCVNGSQLRSQLS